VRKIVIRQRISQAGDDTVQAPSRRRRIIGRRSRRFNGVRAPIARSY
jgi:hypothetical protein